MKQWKVVLIAFATATTFWFFNSLNKNYTTSLRHPVVFNYNTDSLIAVKSLPAYIELDVSGGGWSLLRKSPWFNPRPVIVDLKNPEQARFISWVEFLPVIREQMTEITVNRVLQDTLKIQIEPIVSRRVSIWMDSLQVDIKPGHRLVSPIRFQEQMITLTGPKSFIDTLKRSYKLILSQENIEGSFNQLVPVNVPRPSLIKSDPAQVRVQFEVEKFDRLQIEIPVEPVNFPRDSSRYIQENMAVVFFTVQRSKRGEYVKKNFKLVADYRSITRRDTVIVPQLEVYPPEIMDIELVPATLKVILK